MSHSFPEKLSVSHLTEKYSVFMEACSQEPNTGPCPEQGVCTVWQFGGCHSGVAGDAGLLGFDGTSLGDWFLALKRIVTLFLLD
jgi:hypothetical protein